MLSFNSRNELDISKVEAIESNLTNVIKEGYQLINLHTKEMKKMDLEFNIMSVILTQNMFNCVYMIASQSKVKSDAILQYQSKVFSDYARANDFKEKSLNFYVKTTLEYYTDYLVSHNQSNGEDWK